MKMVGHEAIRQHVALRQQCSLRFVKEELVVLVAKENILAVVAPVKQMVNRFCCPVHSDSKMVYAEIQFQG